MQSLRLFASVPYRTAVIICGVFFAAGLTIASIGPSLPNLAVRIGVDIAALGGLFTAFSAGVIVAQVGVVRASRYFSQRATLAIGMALMSMGAVAIAQGSSLLTLFAAALLGGFGFGGVLATGNTLVAQLFPGRSAAALNGINLFFGVGSIVGPAVAAAANTRFGLPQLTLWIGAGILVVLLPLVLRAAARCVVSVKSDHDYARSATPAQSWLFGLLLLVYVGTEIGFGAWLTLYMVSSAAMDVANAALVLSGFWLALTGGRALAAALGVRMSAHRLLKLCLGGLLVSAILLALSIGNLPFTLVGVLLFGLSCGPVFPTVIALITSTARSDAATSTALALGNGGGMIVPALLGLLLTRFGPPAVTALLIVAALLMIGLGAAAVRPRREVVAAGDAQCVSPQ